jgi:hypothetical protein
MLAFAISTMELTEVTPVPFQTESSTVRPSAVLAAPLDVMQFRKSVAAAVSWNRQAWTVKFLAVEMRDRRRNRQEVGSEDAVGETDVRCRDVDCRGVGGRDGEGGAVGARTEANDGKAGHGDRAGRRGCDILGMARLDDQDVATVRTAVGGNGRHCALQRREGRVEGAFVGVGTATVTLDSVVALLSHQTLPGLVTVSGTPLMVTPCGNPVG